LVGELHTTIQRARRLLDQARVCLTDGMPDGASRLVKLHDADARPIRNGRIGRPVEFGYKAQVADNPDGIVLDYTVRLGNPPDALLLVPAIGRVMGRTGKPPGAVTADRGYGEAAVERDLAAPWCGADRHSPQGPHRPGSPGGRRGPRPAIPNGGESMDHRSLRQTSGPPNIPADQGIAGEERCE
jgi:hypothetical protein